MSSYMKKGKRLNSITESIEVKKRMKYVYAIMGELDDVAAEIYKAKEDWTEENIVEVASKYTKLKIEGLESMLLLGKLQNIKDNETKD